MELKLENVNVMKSITKRDLEVYMSFGFVVRCRMGSLIALRETLDQMFKDSFKYPSFSSSPLYVVHWNDLSEEKKKEFNSPNQRK